ncbi:uncharacterized protein LOC128548535 [Mercenaria mercenaria]|uniref:uncharacterized protein LOC128548535 n=1 Tax=Mercenaria mercenaria TaxID=6596 RepID=UPI00234F7A04|nr:uncharacterized protein LOC128548535 [Mercenaria mercenaria]
MYSVLLQTYALSVAVIICLCQAGIAGQSICAKDLEPVPVKEDLKEGLIYKDGNVIMCTDGTCEKISLENIINAYPDSFSTEEDAVKTTELRYNKYVGELPTACSLTKQYTDTRYISPTCPSFSSYFFWSDRDKCCPTWRYVTFTRGPLTNIYRKQCYILQIPPMKLYQYISVGICGWPRKCRTCRQQYTIQSMLAWCPGNGGVKMHHFRIPTYCTCQ